MPGGQAEASTGAWWIESGGTEDAGEAKHGKPPVPIFGRPREAKLPADALLRFVGVLAVVLDFLLFPIACHGAIALRYLTHATAHDYQHMQRHSTI